MGDYWFKKFYGRNLNKELEKFQKITKIEDDKLLLQEYKATKYVEARKKAFVNKFKKMDNPWMKCKTCGKLIPNDYNVIQRHFITEHIKERPKYIESAFDIIPVPRIRKVLI